MATNMSTVYNDDTEVYTEEYRGEKYSIPGGGSIRLPRREAVALRGTYVSPKVDGNKAALNCKKLRIEHDPITGFEKVTYISHITGEKFSNEKELTAHLKKYESRLVKEDRLDNKEETTSSQVYVCPLCDYESPTKAGVKSHMRGKHDTINTSDKRKGAGS